MDLLVDSTVMRHLVSQLHPDPFCRMTAHLSIGLPSPLKFSVPVTPETMALFEKYKPVAAEGIKSGPSPVSIALSNVQVGIVNKQLKGKVTLFSVMLPTQEAINHMLTFEQSVVNEPTEPS